MVGIASKNLLISFKVPEVPKEAVPEKKMPPVVPKKPEVPPAKGTCGGGFLDGGRNGLRFLNSVLSFVSVMDGPVPIGRVLKY